MLDPFRQGDTFDPAAVHYVLNEGELQELLALLPRASEIVIDLETTGLDEHAVTPVPARVVIASITLPLMGRENDEEAETWVVALSHPQCPSRNVWRSVLTTLARAIKDSGRPITNHNLGFDMRWIEATTGVDLTGQFWWDTQLSSHLLDENSSTKLKERAPATFGVSRWDDHDLSFPGAAETVPFYDLGVYAARDTYWTWRLAVAHRLMTGQVDEPDWPQTPEDQENYRIGELAHWCAMPTGATLTKISQRGMKLDVDWVRAKLAEFDEQRVRTFEGLVGRYGVIEGTPSFSAGSHWFREWSQRACDAGDLRVGAMTPTGRPQWSKAVLTRQARAGSEVAQELLDHRQAVKLSEFLNSWTQLADSSNLIHSTYHAGRVVTGRLSSSDPNMQQCFAGDVEVLTRHGFVRFDDLADGVEILQSDTDGNASWVVPKRVVLPFDGNGVLMSSDSLGDLWMTPNHRVLSYTRSNTPRVEHAEDWLRNRRGTHIIDRKWRRGVHVTGGRHLTLEERVGLELAILAQADGTYHWKAYDVQVYKPRKREALAELWPRTTTRWSENRGQVSYARIPEGMVKEWLDETKNLRLAPLLDLCEEDLAFAVEAAMRWDGDYTRGCTFKQNPVRSRTVDAIQIAATLSGHSTSRYLHKVGDTDYPTVNLHPSDLRYASRTTVSGKHRTGLVYCVEVPDHFFLIRTPNGTPVVTGNCTHSLKPAFVPRPGYYMAELDFSQLELRVAAYVSRCETMLEAYRTGQDLHRLTAAATMGKRVEDVTKDERKKAKAINFGFLYGMGAEHFKEYAEASYGAHFTDEESEQVRERFFQTYPELVTWHSHQINQVRHYGQVTSPIGRVRRLPDAQSPNQWQASHAERNAINSPVQGFGSDLMQIAAARISGTMPGMGPGVPGVHAVGTVHDSIVLEVPIDDWKRAVARCMRIMIDPSPVLDKLGCTLDVPLAVEAEVGTRWGLTDVGIIA